MKKIIFLLALIMALTMAAFGQAGTATHIRSATALPTTCDSDILLLKTAIDTQHPAGLYACFANTWNLIGPGIDTTTPTTGIQANLFGMHLRCPETNTGGGCGTTTTAWPSITTAPSTSTFSTSPLATATGLIRWWNNGNRYKEICPSSGSCSANLGTWVDYDADMRSARTHHNEILYTFGAPPTWSCSAGTGCASGAVPTDTNFTNFAKAVRDRVPDKITLSSCSQSGTLLTCNTTTADGLKVGNRVIIAGTNTSSFNSADSNGYDTMGLTVAAVPTTTQFTTVLPTSATLSSTGGTAGRPGGCSANDDANSGCIRYWEGWNEPNNGTASYAGTIDQLVHLYGLYKTAVKTYDANAKVLGPAAAGYNTSAVTQATGCPGAPVGYGAGSESAGWVCVFLQTADPSDGTKFGKSYVDGTSFHPYTNSNTLATISETPMTDHINKQRLALSGIGLTPCDRNKTFADGCYEIWGTEYDNGFVGSGSTLTNELFTGTCPFSGGCQRIGKTNDATTVDNGGAALVPTGPYTAYGDWLNDQAAFTIKTYALAFSGYGTLTGGINRLIHYKWENNDVWGSMWCRASDAFNDCTTDISSFPYVKPNGIAFGEVQSWLVGASPSNACQQTGNIWTCDYTKNGASMRIVWDSTVSSSSTPTSYSFTGFTTATDMWGNQRSVTSPITIGYSPTLLK